MSKELTAKRLLPLKTISEQKKEIEAVNDKARRDRLIAKLMRVEK